MFGTSFLLLGEVKLQYQNLEDNIYAKILENSLFAVQMLACHGILQDQVRTTLKQVEQLK